MFDSLARFQLFADSFDNQAHFDECMNAVPILQELHDKPAAFWAALCAELFVDNCAVVVGRPDTQVADRLNKEEEERLKSLAANLDKFGCHVLEKDTEEPVGDFTDHIRRFRQ